VVVLDSVITHTTAWLLDREIYQLVFVKSFEFNQKLCNIVIVLFFPTGVFVGSFSETNVSGAGTSSNG